MQQLAGTRGTRLWCLVLETGDELMERLEVFADEESGLELIRP